MKYEILLGSKRGLMAYVVEIGNKFYGEGPCEASLPQLSDRQIYTVAHGCGRRSDGCGGEAHRDPPRIIYFRGNWNATIV